LKSKKPPQAAAAPLPAHIAFIMDGNGRWAQKRLMPRKIGHRMGVEALDKLVAYMAELKIAYVSLYAFSTENRLRPPDEVDGLIGLVREYFGERAEKFFAKKIGLRFMGDVSYFPQDVRDIIAESAKRCAAFTDTVLNVGLNYGSRREIVEAVNEAVRRGKPVTEDGFCELLYTRGMPPPDIIVRTGGEKRLSNFMLYQAAYSELFFVDTLWPDFGPKDLDAVIAEFNGRNRRFGRV
jgi:undecaprenyl diphosphate synthase